MMALLKLSGEEACMVPSHDEIAHICLVLGGGG